MYQCKKWPIKTIEQKDFPLNLKQITPLPEKLFYRGEWDKKLFENLLAVVGSRKITQYGKDLIEEMVPEIVSRNTTIISGFMFGVDSEAHWKCLENKGKTIAVLGNGLDYLYPEENDKLYTKILETGGLVISEYEKDFRPTKWSFPQRNRIVSGLATVGILVIEAGIKSGSLITAKLGMKQNKKILAIPGPINSETSEGTNWLIKSGVARMITDPNDIFEDKIQSPKQESLFKDYSNLSELEKNIIDILENEAVGINEICQKIKKPTDEVSTTLSIMIVKDLILKEGGKFYIS
jgi:DNA processing protein